jgi:uncharacterized protein YidB (DUF937 family)
MMKVIEFILSLFGSGMKKKIMDAIQGNLLGKLGMGQSTDGTDGGPLGQLMKQFQEKGLGNIFNSWVGTGKNENVSPDQVQAAVGPQKMADMAQQTGLSQSELAKQLAKYLPGMVDKLTPNGRLPGQ